MGLNDTVSAERVSIGFFGMRNAGKSSLVNAVTGQHVSVVSEVSGTTTDPVKKAMELLPVGPVMIIDTAGVDDVGALGEKRVARTSEIMAKTDVAVIVVDALKGISYEDELLVQNFKKRGIPFIIAYNKCDLLDSVPQAEEYEIYVSAAENINIFELKEKIGAFAKETDKKRYLVGDLVERGDVVVLVIPIDEAAPKGRLILPQQMTIRDLLEKGCTVVSCRDTELRAALEALGKKPELVITDSQAFARVCEIIPEDVLLTSFSILMARYKGNLEQLIRGAEGLSQIKDGDKILISEGCTHHRQCNDIGTVKLPQKIREYSGAQPEFYFTSGGDFPEDLRGFSLVVHCGGCTLNKKEMEYRTLLAGEQGVPMVNYGIAIAKMNGILDRSIEIFK